MLPTKALVPGLIVVKKCANSLRYELKRGHDWYLMFFHRFPSVYGCLIRYVRRGCALWPVERWVVQAPRSAKIRPVGIVLTGTVLSLALTACNNENISVYRIPKENNQVSMQTGSGNL